MTESNRADIPSQSPFSAGNGRTPVPDTSMLPGAEGAPSAADRFLKKAVQGAHDTLDRVADRAAPAVHKLGVGVSAADEALHTKAARLRQQQHEWTESLSTTVQANPLTSLAVAFAVGALFARVTGRD